MAAALLAVTRAGVTDVAQLGGVATAAAATLAAVLLLLGTRRTAEATERVADAGTLGPLLAGYDALLDQLRAEVLQLRGDLVAARADTAVCEARAENLRAQLAVVKLNVEGLGRQLDDALAEVRRYRLIVPPPPPGT